MESSDHRALTFFPISNTSKGYRILQPLIFQRQASTMGFSTPRFLTMNFSTVIFSTTNSLAIYFNIDFGDEKSLVEAWGWKSQVKLLSNLLGSGHFNLGLFNLKLQPRTFQLQRVEMFMVEKSGVGKYGVENTRVEIFCHLFKKMIMSWQTKMLRNCRCGY